MVGFLTILILCPVAAWAQESDSMFAAIRRNDAAAVEVLLHSGADPNARNPEGATADVRRDSLRSAFDEAVVIKWGRPECAQPGWGNATHDAGLKWSAA